MMDKNISERSCHIFYDLEISLAGGKEQKREGITLNRSLPSLGFEQRAQHSINITIEKETSNSEVGLSDKSINFTLMKPFDLNQVYKAKGMNKCLTIQIKKTKALLVSANEHIQDLHSNKFI